MKNSDQEQALVQLITENKKNSYRLAFRYVKNQDDALDVIQESIQKAFLTMDTIKTRLYRALSILQIQLNMEEAN